MPAKAASGICPMSGESRLAKIRITRPCAKFDQPVLPPWFRLTELRAITVSTGSPPSIPEAIEQTPIAMRSRSGLEARP